MRRLQGEASMSKTAASLMARSDEVAGTYVRRRYAILFYLLLFTFVASPVLTALNRTPRIMELLLATTLSVAVLPMGTGNAKRVLLVLVVIAVSGRLLAVSFGETFSTASHG